MLRDFREERRPRPFCHSSCPRPVLKAVAERIGRLQDFGALLKSRTTAWRKTQNLLVSPVPEPEPGLVAAVPCQDLGCFHNGRCFTRFGTNFLNRAEDAGKGNLCFQRLAKNAPQPKPVTSKPAACFQAAFSPRKHTTFVSSNIRSRTDRWDTSFLACMSSLYLGRTCNTSPLENRSPEEHTKLWSLSPEPSLGAAPKLLDPCPYLRPTPCCTSQDIAAVLNPVLAKILSFLSRQSFDNQAG